MLDRFKVPSVDEVRVSEEALDLDLSCGSE
jgi:hypothetical protein